jgi:NADH-quinone oxidoreductase subunit B
MGVFNNYAIVPADKFMPVDVHVPGCPPRPEALMHGILKLRKMIQDDPDMGWREGYGARGTEELVESDDPARDTAINVFGPGRTAGA